MAIAEKDYFWNKLKRARRAQEKRAGKNGKVKTADDVTVDLLAPSLGRGQPLDIVGFESPEQVLANARRIDMTGAGPNGITEPDNPAALIDTTAGPRMIHEREALVEPNGGPPNQRAVLSNAQLQEVERRYNVPGLFTGSQNYPPARRQEILKRIEQDYNVRGYQDSSIRVDPFGRRIPVRTDEPPEPPQILESGLVDTGGPQETATMDMPAPDFTTVLPAGLTATDAPQETVEMNVPVPTVVEGEESAPPPVWVTSAVGGDAGIVEPGAAGEFGAGAAEGFEFIRDIMRGDSPALDIAENRALEDQAARNVYEDAATAQELEALGISPSQRAVLRGMVEREQRSATGDLLADIAQKRAQSAEEAARDVVRIGLEQDHWQRNFNQRIEEYGDQQGWMQYNELLKTGDFDGAAAKYKAITGEGIDLGDLRDEYYNDKAADAAVALAGLVDRTWHTLPLDDLSNPDWLGSTAYVNDGGSGSVQRYWRWNNDGEEFDPNNLAHVSEMNDTILKSMSMSDVSEDIAKLKTEDWYQDLQTRAAANDPKAIADLALWDGALVGLSQLSYLDGYQIGMEDGKIVFKDASGEVQYTVDPPPGVTIPDYESIGGVRELLGDGYDDILARTQADDPDQGAITADLMSIYGFTADQADNAFETMRYEGYDDYVASATTAGVTPMTRDEWLVDRPEDVMTAGVPANTSAGDVWFDEATGDFYMLGDDGREPYAMEEGTPLSVNNRKMVEAWHDYVKTQKAADPTWVEPAMPVALNQLLDEQAVYILRNRAEFPSGMTEDHPLYQRIRDNNTITIRSIGSQTRHTKGLKPSDERFEFEKLETTGKWCVIEGKLFWLSSKARNDRTGLNSSTYYLQDPLAGDMYYVRAGPREAGRSYPPVTTPTLV